MDIITLASLFLSSLVLIQGKGVNGGKNLNGEEWMRRILCDAYPNWLPWTQLLNTYEQLYQEAFPVWKWITLVSANLIQMRNTDGYGEIRLIDPDDCRDRSTSSTVSVTQEVEP